MKLFYSSALYLSRKWCLAAVLFLSACAHHAAPYQAMSEAKQALHKAKIYVEKDNQADDKKDYTIAQQNLDDAENAIKQKQYPQAEAFIRVSKKHAKNILKRQQKQTTSGSNIQFRY